MDARSMWRVVEPYHQLAYRSPEAVAQMQGLGLHRPELQYFGARLAALGPVVAPVAVAVLYGFAPAYVQRAIPEVWERADPASITQARRRAADETLRRILGALVDAATIARAAELARRAATAADLPGRPLAAAHLAQPWPDEAHLVLWHACTVLREHRGDAHWVATAAAGLDAVECHVLHGADGHMPPEMLQRVTGWDDPAWAAATDRLRERALIGPDGVTTAAGAALKERLERHTDELADVPYRELGAPERRELQAVLASLVRPILDAGVAEAWKLREQLWRHPPPADA